MIPLVLVLGLIAVPVVLGLLLRIQSTLIFVSIIAGYTLVGFLTDDASLALNTVNARWDNKEITQIGLLLLPLVGSLIFGRGSSKLKSGIILQALALVASGFLLAVLLQPLLPSDLQATILTTEIGHSLLQARDLVVGIAILVNCLAMWLGNGSHRHYRSKGH